MNPCFIYFHPYYNPSHLYFVFRIIPVDDFSTNAFFCYVLGNTGTIMGGYHRYVHELVEVRS